MDSLEQSISSKTSLKRLRIPTLSKRPEPQAVLGNALATDINSGSAFLQLPAELRICIYEHAFSRSPVEIIQALHYDSPVTPASGLLLTCHQTRKEAWKLYHQDTIVSLWPQCHDNATLHQKSILEQWLPSRSGNTLVRHPGNVQQLALLISLKRETRTMCQNFIETEILRNARLQIKDLYIRVCICGALKWLCEHPSDVASFCAALNTFATHFSTLERIHVLYCGQQWPVWIQALGDVPFPEIAFAGQEARSAAVWERLPTQVKPGKDVHAENSEDICVLRTSMTWNQAAAPPRSGQIKQQPPWKGRSVEINYYDSWMVLKERCVRNKPPQPSMLSVRITVG